MANTKSNVSMKPLPAITSNLQFAAASTSNPLGPLAGLLGTWFGTGFNVIWRPNSVAGQDHFLELNLTEETLQFDAIDGSIANRGLLQPDIEMFGLTYLQQIKDKNAGVGLHVEPGIWANVPLTTNPPVVPSVVRMASIPHGTTVIAQGVATSLSVPPTIPSVDITPFVFGDSTQKVLFKESTLTSPTAFRTPDSLLAGILQPMVDNPNSVLISASAAQTILSAMQLDVSSDPTTPVLGGGVANTAFLQGSPNRVPGAGPNAQTVLVTATFWIETVKGDSGAPDFPQLQYTQTVLLNFAGLSWPHISVATLRKKP